MNFDIKKITIFGFSAFLLFLSKILKFGLMMGGKFIQFSSVNIFGPAIVSAFGYQNLIFLVLFSLVLKFFGFMPPLDCVTLGIPTLASIFALNSLINKNKLTAISFNIVLPFICMILFFLSPSVIGLARIYALYWVIPIVGYFCINHFKINSSILSLFLASLSSTFIAHATGTVIWSYRVPMIWQQWVSLVPVVAIERLVFALGITLSTYFLLVMKQILNSNKVSKETFFLQTL